MSDAHNEEIRELTSADGYANQRLMEHAFGRGRVVAPPEPGGTPPDMSGVYGLFEAGNLQASVGVVPFLVHWGPSLVLPMGGVAGVATWADARGRGHVARLLRFALEQMRNRGQVISALYPFSWSFYRNFGWDWVGEQRHVKLPLRELKSDERGRDVRHVEGDEAAVREKLTLGYTAFAKRYRGVCTTETHRWGNRLAHSDNRSTYPYMYEASGAYLLWRFANDGNGQIREWAASTSDEYRALLSLLHYFGTQTSEASVSLPLDSPLQSFLMHWSLKTELRPVFMGRVVDVEGAMRTVDASGVPNNAATIAIRDENAPWNNGVWRFTVEDGRVSAALAVGFTDTPNVSVDIQAFSQAFWGHPSLGILRQAGRVDVAQEAGFDFLSQLLPAHPVYTLDDF